MTRVVNACLLVLAGVATSGCSGSTGSGLTAFSAYVAGPVDVVAGAPYTFTSQLGYAVSLTAARFHVAAIYLNKLELSSGSPAQDCILPGVYVDEVFGACSGATCGLDVDLLAPAPTPFPAPGDGTLDPAFTAELWLSGGDINASDDETPILQVAGTATKEGLAWPFAGTVTIGSNHTLAPSNVATPGGNPICRQRIVTPSLVPQAAAGATTPVPGITVAGGGTLTLRVDLANLFLEVDFAKLAAAGSTTTLTIPDDASTVGEQLFDGVTNRTGPPPPGSSEDLRVYRFDVSNP